MDDRSVQTRRARVSTLISYPGELPATKTSDLVALLYEELKYVASSLVRKQAPGETLRPTALVNEAYLRLTGSSDLNWNSRAHFFGAAARAMRNVLADYWRERKTKKRGGYLERVTLDTSCVPALGDADTFEDVNRALETLAGQDPRAGEIVMLRFFVGLSVKECAEVLGLSVRTVEREWTFAKTYLSTRLGGD